MLVVMKAHATEEEVRAVCQKIESLGYRAHALPGAERTAIGITGNKGVVEAGTLDEMPGVQELIRVSKPYKLVSRDIKPDNTVIRFKGNDATIGGKGLAIMAGPCSIESHEQAFAVAERVSPGGRTIFPRRSLQAANLSVFFPGTGRRRLAHHGGCARPVWTEDHYRSHR